MKKLLLISALCMTATSFYAQKDALKSAKSAFSRNGVLEAIDLLKPALTDDETKNDPDTWKLAGDIRYRLYKDELTNEEQKYITQKGADYDKMYSYLLEMYEPYLLADSLGQVPDTKGKIKNKYRRDIAKAFVDVHMYYLNAGGHFNNKKEYTKASKCFEVLWNLPSLDMFHETTKGAVELVIPDSVLQKTKYYSVVTAIQASQEYESPANIKRSISLLNRLINEGYVENPDYIASVPYELLATQYQRSNDSINFVRTIRVGADKFRENKYFAPNLINEYIRGGLSDSALVYIDQAIKNDPNSGCDLYVLKGVLYADKKDFDQSESAYLEAIKADENCQKALEGVGVLYMLKAQELRDISEKESDKAKQNAIEQEAFLLYQKALPLLEQYANMMRENPEMSKRDVRDALVRLQTAYYNITILSKQAIDKSKDIDVLDKELEKYQD